MEPRRSRRLRQHSNTSLPASVLKPTVLIGYQVAVTYQSDRYLARIHSYLCPTQEGSDCYYRARLQNCDIVFLTPVEALQAVLDFNEQKSLRLSEWCEGKPARSSEGSLNVWGAVTETGSILQSSFGWCDVDKNKIPSEPTRPTRRKIVLTLSGADYQLVLTSSSTNPPLTPDMRQRLEEEGTRLTDSLPPT